MRDKEKPQEFWTAERCYIAELLNSADNPEVSVARTRVDPGITTQLHALSVDEWYVIESGTGLMTVDDKSAKHVGAGDVIAIAKHESQKIENNGSDDLIFLCVCTPRFSAECYTSLE